MRTVIAVALSLIVWLIPVDQIEAFSVQPQQMQPVLDQAFKEQRRQAIEAASRRAAKDAAEKRAQEQEERSAQQMKTAMLWGAGIFGGFILMKKLRS